MLEAPHSQSHVQSCRRVRKPRQPVQLRLALHHAAHKWQNSVWSPGLGPHILWTASVPEFLASPGGPWQCLCTLGCSVRSSLFNIPEEKNISQGGLLFPLQVILQRFALEVSVLPCLSEAHT